MEPRGVFLNFCTAIARAMADDGFKSLQKGQRLKKMLGNNDISCEHACSLKKLTF
ncbi:MAG: hypothetical protein JXX14_10370 [Deltaproteobacteria bacterium]|nr:hypothetical protein [Deltaproteobacteria bacterium]